MSSNNINNRTPTDLDEISLKEFILKIREYFNYVLSKWLIILVIGFVGSALGFIYASFQKPVYTATTTFVLQDDKSGGGLGSLVGFASMAGVDLGVGGSGIFQGDNILSLYKSRNILEQTLLSSVDIDGKKQLLIDRYIEFNDLRKNWEDKPELSKIRFTRDSVFKGEIYRKPDRLRDSIFGVIVGDLSKNYLTVTRPDKKLSTIQVDVKSRDEVFAKDFNDALVRNVNEFYITTKTKKTLVNVKILQHKTDSVRAVMNGAIYSAVAIADATPNLNSTRQIQRVAPSQRAQFSVETNRTILSELVKNLELTKMSLLKETPLIQVIDLPIYPLKREKFGRLKGLIYGGLIAGFITIAFVVISRIFKQILE